MHLIFTPFFAAQAQHLNSSATSSPAVSSKSEGYFSPSSWIPKDVGDTELRQLMVLLFITIFIMRYYFGNVFKAWACLASLLCHRSRAKALLSNNCTSCITLALSFIYSILNFSTSCQHYVNNSCFALQVAFG